MPPIRAGVGPWNRKRLLASLRADARFASTGARYGLAPKTHGLAYGCRPYIQGAKGWGPAVRIVGLMSDAGSKVRIALGSQPKASWFVAAAAPASQAAGPRAPNRRSHGSPVGYWAPIGPAGATGHSRPSPAPDGLPRGPARCQHRSVVPRTARGQYARSGPAAGTPAPAVRRPSVGLPDHKACIRRCPWPRTTPALRDVPLPCPAGQNHRRPGRREPFLCIACLPCITI